MIVFQRRIANLLAAWIALVFATSIAAAIDLRHGGDLFARLALVPDRVWRGEVWRLVTWIFVELDPKALVFGCIGIYWFGGELLAGWGPRRLVRRLGGIALFAGVATTVLALAFPHARHLPYFGSAAMGDALLVSWGLTFPQRQIRVWMMLVVDGQTIAYGMCALTVLYALFWGLAPVLPLVLACGAAFAIAGGALPRWWRLRMRIVKGGKPPEPPHGPYYTN